MHLDTRREEYMHLDSRLKAALAAATSAGLLAALLLGGTASNAGAQAPCTPANNLEAIIDDSGSMSGTDSDRFRVDLVNILASLNREKSMGAVQFGSDASALFAPAQIGPNLGAIAGALNLIQADDGGTDYEAGFNLANSQNPNANARIFLSDGAPNFDPDPNVWRNPNIKTYRRRGPGPALGPDRRPGGPQPDCERDRRPGAVQRHEQRTAAHDGSDHQRADQLPA